MTGAVGASSGGLAAAYSGAITTGVAASAVSGPPLSAVTPTAAGGVSDGKKKADKAAINWVQCERPTCGKWRVVPANVDFVTLKKKKWYCDMNTWDKRYVAGNRTNSRQLRLSRSSCCTDWCRA